MNWCQLSLLIKQPAQTCPPDHPSNQRPYWHLIKLVANWIDSDYIQPNYLCFTWPIYHHMYLFYSFKKKNIQQVCLWDKKKKSVCRKEIIYVTRKKGNFHISTNLQATCWVITVFNSETPFRGDCNNQNKCITYLLWIRLKPNAGTRAPFWRSVWLYSYILSLIAPSISEILC